MASHEAPWCRPSCFVVHCDSSVVPTGCMDTNTDGSGEQAQVKSAYTVTPPVHVPTYYVVAVQKI